MTKLPFLDVSVSGRVRSIAAGISVSNLPPPRRLPRPTLSRPASPTEDGAWAPPVQEIQLILPTLWSAYIRLNSHPRWLWLAKQPKCIFIAKTYCVAWLVVEAPLAAAMLVWIDPWSTASRKQASLNTRYWDSELWSIYLSLQRVTQLRIFMFYNSFHYWTNEAFVFFFFRLPFITSYWWSKQKYLFARF